MAEHGRSVQHNGIASFVLQCLTHALCQAVLLCVQFIAVCAAASIVALLWPKQKKCTRCHEGASSPDRYSTC